MAESFMVVIADKVLGQITSPFVQELSLSCNLKADLRKLQNTLSHVKAAILDAEEQQLTSHEVCTWLGQLKDVLYDAEDLFDEFSYEALRKQLLNSPTRGGIGKKVRRFLSMSSNPIAFRLKMSRKLKDIREAFDEVAANKTKFHNPQIPNNSTLLTNKIELTHSFVNSSLIIGRDGDRDIIVRSLLDSHNIPNGRVPVVSIVGIGGLGKTALAKMVFNDQRVVNHFEKKVWVCLGDLKEFIVSEVMDRIVQSITGGKGIHSDPQHLHKCFRDYSLDKKLLLVLDDVWVVNRSKWLEFKQVLLCGANGSRVVVTTRSPPVASSIGSILTHNLEGLPHDQCVSLLKQFAFNDTEDDQELMKIGDVIVGKCKGVPLAIKTLGCLLFSKRSKAEWEFVRDNDMWRLKQNKDDILPALKISYNSLSFILKQCFAYCSTFPKDHVFGVRELLYYWEAMGLIRSSVKDTSFEDTGKEYVNELCARGFFQDFDEFSTMGAFKMHDLIHDLALSVAQNELKNMKAERQGKDIYKSIRHVSFSRRVGLGGEEVPKLFLTNNPSSSCVMQTNWSVFFESIGCEGRGTVVELVKTCISNLKNLRIMDLSDTISLERLPDSVGALKHLRILKLTGCKRLKRLPNYVCQLYNLQTLSLRGCEELEELPKHTGDLVNLRNLEITTKQKHLSEGAGNGIESLSSLQYLWLYECENLEYIFELGTSDDHIETHRQLLKSIQTLMIERCKSLTSLFPSTSMKKQRGHLSDLETLFIMDCPKLDLASIFNEQISLIKLKFLAVGDLPQMESLPQWISLDGCANSLESLLILYCPNLKSLPEWLQNLTSLRQLIIIDCPQLLCLPEGLSTLKELEIKDCQNLSTRCQQETGEDWLKIKHIPKIWLDGKLQQKLA